MSGSVFYRIAADLVLAVHTSFVIFVILGLVLILVGGVRSWRWVKNPWFRMGHLLAIGVVGVGKVRILNFDESIPDTIRKEPNDRFAIGIDSILDQSKYFLPTQQLRG